MFSYFLFFYLLLIMCVLLLFSQDTVTDLVSTQRAEY